MNTLVRLPSFVKVSRVKRANIPLPANPPLSFTHAPRVAVPAQPAPAAPAASPAPTSPSTMQNMLSRGGKHWAGMGALAGGALGALFPGKDDDGESRGALGGALRGAVAGGVAGGLGGMAAKKMFTPTGATATMGHVDAASQKLVADQASHSVNREAVLQGARNKMEMETLQPSHYQIKRDNGQGRLQAGASAVIDKIPLFRRAVQPSATQVYNSTGMGLNRLNAHDASAPAAPAAAHTNPPTSPPVGEAPAGGAHAGSAPTSDAVSRARRTGDIVPEFKPASFKPSMIFGGSKKLGSKRMAPKPTVAARVEHAFAAPKAKAPMTAEMPKAVEKSKDEKPKTDAPMAKEPEHAAEDKKAAVAVVAPATAVVEAAAAPVVEVAKVAAADAVVTPVIKPIKLAALAS